MTDNDKPVAAAAAKPAQANENSLAFALPGSTPSAANTSKVTANPAELANRTGKPKTANSDGNNDNAVNQAGADVEEGIDPLSEIVAVTAGETVSAAAASSGLVGGIGGVTAAAPLGLAAAGAAAVGLAGAGGDDAPTGASGSAAPGSGGSQNTSSSELAGNNSGAGANGSSGAAPGGSNTPPTSTTTPGTTTPGTTTPDTNTSDNTNNGSGTTPAPEPSTLSDHVDTVLNIEDPAGEGYTLDKALSPVLDATAPAGPTADVSLRDVLDTVITAEVPGAGPIAGTPLEGASLDTLPQAQIPQQAPVLGGNSLNTVLDPLLDTLSGTESGDGGEAEPSEPAEPPSVADALRTAAVPVTAAAATGDSLIEALGSDAQTVPGQIRPALTEAVEAGIEDPSAEPDVGGAASLLTESATATVLTEAGADLQSAIAGATEQPESGGGGSTAPAPAPAPTGAFSETLDVLEGGSGQNAGTDFNAGAAELDKQTAVIQDEIPEGGADGGDSSSSNPLADSTPDMDALISALETTPPSPEELQARLSESQPAPETLVSQLPSRESPSDGDTGSESPFPELSADTLTDQIPAPSGDTQAPESDGPQLSTSLADNTETAFDSLIDGADQIDEGIASIPTSPEQGEDFLTSGGSGISSTAGAGPLPDSFPPV